MDTRSAQSGFSLLELMVTIGIVAVISAFGLVNLSTIQKNSLDSQRQADLRVIQGALQQFYSDLNRYPDNITLSSATSITNCTGVSGCSSPNKTYLSIVPKDPTTGTTNPYCYTAFLSRTSTTQCTSSSNSGLCHFYKLYARLDNPSGSTTYTCSNGGVGNYTLEVTPL